MGQRLTLPLLLLAALLAGGAFFWMTGSEREAGGSARTARPESVAASTPATPELVAAETPTNAPVSPAARVELAQPMEPAPVAAKPKTARAALEGRVLDRFGAAVAGARVTIAADTGFPIDLELEREFPWLRRQRAETNSDGRFRFDAVEPGSLQVAVSAGGFAPFEQRGVAVPAGGAELEPFVLARGAILSGIVVDPDGRPVADARVLRVQLEDTGFFMIGEREPAATTGADGRFRVDRLACGPWRFVVRSEEHPDLEVEGQADEPGVEQSGLRWQLSPGATIAGTVTGVPSGERGQLEVRATKGAGFEGIFGLGSGRTARVESNGSFLVRGLEVGGSYALQARHTREEDEFSPWERSRSESVQARAGDAGVVLAYQPEAALTFVVHDAKTRLPLEAFQVESGVDWAMPLRDEDGRPRTRFPGGAVRVGGLRPSSPDERVQLTVKATGYADYQRSDIAVRAGQELDLGALYLEPVPLVRVHVLDAASGAPVAGARVRMQQELGDRLEIRHSITIGEDEGAESIDFGVGRSATTDGDGWAELTSLEGETVEVTARADGYAPAKRAGLALPRGETLELELRVSPGGEVLVRVLDAGGLPLAGARVERRAQDAAGPGGMIVLGGPRGPESVTDGAGEVVFENLEPGTHSFRIAEERSGPMFATSDSLVIAGLDGGSDEGWSPVQVEEGGRAELVLRAAPRGGLTGQVREAGKLLAGARLRLEPEQGGAAPRIRLPGMNSGPEAQSDGEGRFEFADVKEGRYTLTVEHPTRRMPQEYALELREGRNSFDVDLPLSILAGRVLDQEGKGLAGVRVWAERQAGDGPRFAMRMVMVDDSGGGGMFDSGEFGERATTDADGRYELRGVTSDADLVVKAEGDAVQPGKSETVRVAPNEVRERLDLVLAPAGSILVEANLPDGSPARFQLVQATYLGEEEPRPEPKFGFLQSGSTELKGLKPGPWRVNVRPANDGPRGTGGVDREVVVEAGAEATASFEVE
jgi:protocatechuate 3,4-dioxygenase beta subunit